MILGNSKQTDLVSQVITIRDSVIKDLNYEFFDDIFVTTNVQASVPFSLVLESLTFENINFVRGGNLMLLGHQQDDFAEINHCVFNNITNAGISVVSYLTGIADTSKTKVKMTNVTTNTFQADTTRFLVLGDGAQVEMHDSTMRTISSERTGAVVFAGPSRASMEIFNSDFFNNTALIGGVFSAHSESYISCTNCNIYNNHAVSNGVIIVEENGYFMFSDSHIYSNFASQRPIGEVFSTFLTSTISNCTIERNLALDVDNMKALIANQGKSLSKL